MLQTKHRQTVERWAFVRVIGFRVGGALSVRFFRGSVRPEGTLEDVLFRERKVPIS
ncbi:hypothetical protein ALP18_200106 [Pseudomonas amygdali pv. myricae]|nr:hypothetical protein ALP18_200106 [Pseudomonas amygdali pv. myricae]